MASPSVSLIVPTRGRLAYLDVALASLVPQAHAAGGETIVVEDGGDAARELAEARGARWIGLPAAGGPNAARNAGIAAALAPLVVLTEDDVEAPPGWLDALLAAAAAEPDVDVFGGPIRGRVDGRAWRTCGQEWPPISSFDRGPANRDVDLVFAGNMLVRRSALDRVGPFAASLGLYADEADRIAGATSGAAPAAGFFGDEEEWQDRYRAAGGRVRYVAAGRLDHRRAGADATTKALIRAAFARGRVARRWSESRGRAPSLVRELRVLAGSVWHLVARRCLNGLLFAADAAGRVGEAMAPEQAIVDADSYLAPGSGLVLGHRANLRAALADAALDTRAGLVREGPRLDRASAEAPPRRILVLAVERTDVPNVLPQARAELARSKHDVTFATAATGGRGKFENLNALLAQHALADYDWLLVLDDDVALPGGFLDRFVFLAERFGFELAQPAHRHRSHAAWPVTRRRPDAARRTQFVEIGPVTAFHRPTFETLLPFPALRMGWGLDAHWAAVARERDWPIGIVDATPVRHGLRRTGSGYAHADAVAEAQAFLDGRPYVTRAEAGRSLQAYRRW